MTESLLNEPSGKFRPSQLFKNIERLQVNYIFKLEFYSFNVMAIG
jgi:hypothetical protein